MSSAAKELTTGGYEQIGEPRIYEWKCKICKSDYRDEIDALILRGTKYEDIVNFAAERGLSISESGITRHKQSHTLAPRSEVTKRLENSELAAHALYTRIMRELHDRDLKELATAELLTHARGAGEVLVGFRSLKEVRQPH
jgi:hypothetical protein